MPRINTGDEYLYQGDIFISNLHKKAITVLGSCVSVILYAERYKIGGMNHGLYPTINDKIDYGKYHKTDTIYTDFSITTMLMIFNDYGIKNNEITAKVFGGAEITERLDPDEKSYQSVGSMNLESAFKVLSENHINVIKQDIGGNLGRKIIFFTDTGEVFMKYLDKVPYKEFDENMLRGKNV